MIAEVDTEAEALRNPLGEVGTPSGNGLATSSRAELADGVAYTEALSGLVATLGEVQPLSRRSVQAQLDRMWDLLRIKPYGPEALSTRMPILMLRLGLDQDCWEFMNCWYRHWTDTVNWRSVPEFPPVSPMADVFERCRYIWERKVRVSYTSGLSYMATTTLLKIRLLIDIRAICASFDVLILRFPREITDRIRDFIPSATLADKHLTRAESDKLQPLIRELEHQVKELYKEVQRINPHFWPELVRRSASRTKVPSNWEKEDRVTSRVDTQGSAATMRAAMYNTFGAWIESPLAIDYIRQMRRE